MSVQVIVIEEAKRAGIRQNEQAQILHLYAAHERKLAQKGYIKKNRLRGKDGH